MQIKNKVELLAPVGSMDCLQAAINAGADAIYFGVAQLNMRTRSTGSFGISHIKEISERCKAAGIKSCITLNTIMYEHDMQLLLSILKEVKKQQVDAVIAADFSVIEYCMQLNIPLHVSTQANISNIESVCFYARFADVVVLARELTLKQVGHICSEIKRRNIVGVSGELLKVEIFVHGALCMAISGKCYLSLHSQNASANRGACVQNCRRTYTVTDAETHETLLVSNEYIMSAKDLCCIPFLDEVISTGVAVLKIEGRSKGADYVHTVTSCYREAITAMEENEYSKEKIANWMKRLSTVYNRGFWDGYYLGRKMGEWTDQPGSVATEKKVYAGKGSKYYPKIAVAEFLIEAGSITAGDTLLLTGDSFGVAKIPMQVLVVNGREASKAVKGDKITFPFNNKIKASDKLYKLITSPDA